MGFTPSSAIGILPLRDNTTFKSRTPALLSILMLLAQSYYNFLIYANFLLFPKSVRLFNFSVFLSDKLNNFSEK